MIILIRTKAENIAVSQAAQNLELLRSVNLLLPRLNKDIRS